MHLTPEQLAAEHADEIAQLREQCARLAEQYARQAALLDLLFDVSAACAGHLEKSRVIGATATGPEMALIQLVRLFRQAGVH